MARTRFQWLALFVAVLAIWPAVRPVAADQSAVVVGQRHGQSLRGTVSGFSFVVLRGTHRQRGEAHGALAARDILNTCDSMGGFVMRQPGAWAGAVAAMKRFSFEPRFCDELAGMLQGIRKALPQGSDRVLQSTGKEIELDDLKVLQAADLFELARCSQFSAWGELTSDGQVIVGRNWDYPPLFPRQSCCLLAVEPSETGLRPTLDAVWFGLIGCGLATLRDDGLYVAANSGGRSPNGRTLEQPLPGSLLMRSYTESAAGPDLARVFCEKADARLVLPLIFHLVPPRDQPGDNPVAIEYFPAGASFRSRVRKAEARPPWLVIANHFISRPADLDDGRSGVMRAALRAAAEAKRPIGFAEACEILEGVRKGNTYYVAVVWPHQRIVKLALPVSGTPLTRTDFITVRWEDVFSRK